jgi:hypothetical protein
VDRIGTLSQVEEKAEKAHRLEREVVVGSLSVRRAWIQLAGVLHTIQAEKLYELLGYERFTEWIAAPEIGMGRSHAYALTSIYQELVVERGIPEQDLYYIEPTKLAEVMPWIRQGGDVEQALADATELSRSDLRAKYRKEENEPEDAAESVICPVCGSKVTDGQIIKSIEEMETQ